MTYLIKAHHHGATPIKYTEIESGDTIARPIRDTYIVGTAAKKANRRWTTEQGEILATPQHKNLFRINNNQTPPVPGTDQVILAYKLTAGTENTTHTNHQGWPLRTTDDAYAPLDGNPIHGDDYFLPEEIHEWLPATITPGETHA